MGQIVQLTSLLFLITVTLYSENTIESRAYRAAVGGERACNLRISLIHLAKFKWSDRIYYL